METQERKERREKRIQSLKNCQTPIELSFNIWTKQSEEIIGDRSIYRNPFVEWIESYKAKTNPEMWTSYKTPTELAEGIWKPYLDRADDYDLFSDLRNALVEWIERYGKKLR